MLACLLESDVFLKESLYLDNLQKKTLQFFSLKPIHSPCSVEKNKIGFWVTDARLPRLL